MKMLEYQKMILRKVSFSAELFVKEFKKSFKWLNKDEINDLVDWVKYNFTEFYNKITVKEKGIKALPINTNQKKFRL